MLCVGSEFSAQMALGSLSYHICHAEVHGQRDDGRYKAGPYCACEVRDIADKPNNQEDERNAVCRARFVVLDQLRDLVGISYRSHEG